MWDAVVVGGGVAGLSAATWLGRYCRRTLVVDAGEHRNRAVRHAHGLLGRDPISPDTLMKDARAGLEQYPQVSVRRGVVDGARRLHDGTFAVTADGEVLTCRRVVLATGVRDRCPELPRFVDHYGRDISHCPSCDGFEARGQRVAVFGWDAHIAAVAIQLLDWTHDICVITNGSPAAVSEADRTSLAARGIPVVEDKVTALLGDPGRLEGAELATGAQGAFTKAFFFSIEHQPKTELARQLGCAIQDDGHVQVDSENATSVPGVYAAGDLTPGMQLIPVGISKGTVAGVACALSLHGEPPAPGAPVPAPDVTQDLECAAQDA